MIYNKIHMWVDKPFLHCFRKYTNGKTEYHTLSKSIGIFTLLKTKLKQYDIKYPNFSNYNNGRVTIRFGIDESDYDECIYLVHEFCRYMLSDGGVRKYQIDEVVVPEFVMKAHEVSSSIASYIFFSEKLNSEVEKHSQAFFKYFTNKLFKYYKLPEPFCWTGIRRYLLNPDKDLDDIIDDCLKKNLNKKDSFYRDGDYLERLLHLLQNCLLIQDDDMEKNYWLIFSRDMLLKQAKKFK